MQDIILRVLREVSQERRGIAVPEEEEAQRIAEALAIKPKVEKPKKVIRKKKK